MQDSGDIRFERIGRAGVITLTRPKALNAVTYDMLLAIAGAARAWREDDAVRLVILKAEGRAFSAGGDIQAIYEAHKAGAPLINFFADEYRLNAAIRNYPKPWVALVDGLAMGGGVGISFHGSHRVMSENAAFAMPETAIGFFPDVGASFFLPRLAGETGLWLGLTGARLKAEDAAACGLATHRAPSADFPAILAALCETGDPARLSGLAEAAPEKRQTPDGGTGRINRLFAAESLQDLMDGLKNTAGDEWAAEQARILSARCPLSLAVTFRQLRAGRSLTIEECLKMEFRIVSRMLIGHDFYEGIRAAIIDKDNAPHWSHSSVEAVEVSDVDACFAPLGTQELTF